LDGKPGPFVQQLAVTQTDTLPEKRPRLLKELPNSVKQKNPEPKKRIKIPDRNKGGSHTPHLGLAGQHSSIN
jgi:hypothetical protein